MIRSKETALPFTFVGMLPRNVFVPKDRSGLLLCIFLAILIHACSGVKKTSTANRKLTKKEYTELSEKLQVEIDDKCNIKLYRLVADWYGVPHKDGGCEKSGTDCSCFVRMVIDEVYNKQLPRTTGEMYKKVSEKNGKLKEGDLLFFNTKSKSVSHVGIYLKDDLFVHVSTSKGVMINNLNETYYRKTYVGSGKVD